MLTLTTTKVLLLSFSRHWHWYGWYYVRHYYTNYSGYYVSIVQCPVMCSQPYIDLSRTQPGLALVCILLTI